MIEEQATVVKVEADEGVWVETVRKTACNRCSARSGCGQKLVEQYRERQGSIVVKTRCHFSVSVGDQVVVGVPEGHLLKASMHVYLIPLLGLMSMVAIAFYFQTNDFLTLLLCASGLVSGFSFVRWSAQQDVDACHIRVTRGVPGQMDKPGCT